MKAVLSYVECTFMPICEYKALIHIPFENTDGVDTLQCLLFNTFHENNRNNS